MLAFTAFCTGRETSNKTYTCAGTTKTLDLKFLVALAMTCLAQRQCGLRQDGAGERGPRTAGAPSTTDIPTPCGAGALCRERGLGAPGPSVPLPVSPVSAAEQTAPRNARPHLGGDCTACFWGLGRSCSSSPCPGEDSRCGGHGVL